MRNHSIDVLYVNCSATSIFEQIVKFSVEPNITFIGHIKMPDSFTCFQKLSGYGWKGGGGWEFKNTLHEVVI